MYLHIKYSARFWGHKIELNPIRNVAPNNSPSNKYNIIYNIVKIYNKV